MITIKSDREIELMREAGYMVSKTHKYLKPFIKEGITTKELDRLAEEYIRSMGGVPTCKGFEGFPATLCTSINDEVVHGKATIINKMWGLHGDKLAQVKALYVYMMLHPGKKLNFMGNELAEYKEWDESKSLGWDILKYPDHDAFHHFAQKLNEMG